MHKQFSTDMMIFKERCVIAAPGSPGWFLIDHFDR